MAEIKSPLTVAMKRRAKTALEALGYNSSATYTPRKLREIILRVDDSNAVRLTMKEEGWFEAAAGAGWKAKSNQSVGVV